MTDKPREVDEIFSAAIEISSEIEREAFVLAACGTDESLKLHVERLVAAYFRADGFLESPALDSADTVASGVQEMTGTMIGRYQLLQQIGEGGFAIVFMAEQQHPVRRRVALKIIKAGMDTKQVVARFEAERQALAMMDHPSIAKVLDAGTTAASEGEYPGRPYFVMDLVKGVPITEYSDHHQLSIDQRLDLFVQVCQAVQHAHQKGVIHRDIKPTNVLVSTQDNRPLAKVIDFGIAKAAGTPLTDRTLFTDFNQLIGTPAYMSPEQADGSLDIDTRSDVYSLGVLLYELLAGTPPFDPRELRSKCFAEMQRVIREVEPPTPSTRLSGLDAQTQSTRAKQRHIDPQRLTQHVRGEPDWIVMKALEKDRNRRYPTANALAMDLQRHLTDEPVEACPPSTVYRLKKFARRNKVGVLAGFSILLSLMVALGIATWSLSKQRLSHARALAAEQILRSRAEASDNLAQAQLLVNQGQVDQAEQILSLVPPEYLRDFSERTDLLCASIGFYYVKRGNWAAAKEQFWKLVEIEPSKQENYHALGPLLVQGGDLAGYARFRRQAIAQFGNTTDRKIAERTAKDCLILPVSGPELDSLAALADASVMNLEGASVPLGYPWIQCTKGLAEYRKGNFASAIEWMSQSAPREMAGHPGYRFIDAHSVIAMSHFHLHDLNAAQVELERTERAFKTAPSIARPDFFDKDDMAFVDWIIANSLLTEARALIEGNSKPATESPRF